MNVIFIDVVLCELATDYKTNSVYIEGLNANPDSTPLHIDRVVVDNSRTCPYANPLVG